MVTKEMFHSKSLNRTVELGIVIPDDFDKVLILLHGYNGSYQQLMSKLPLEKYAEKHSMLICMPNCINDYFIGQNNDRFIAYELLGFLKQHYKTKDKEILLSGISMGGYGAYLIGLHHPETFSTLISFSGAFIAENVKNRDLTGVDFYNPYVLEWYENTFAPFETLDCDTNRNPEALLEQIETDKCPKFYLSCGTRDSLYDTNLKLVRKLHSRNIPVNWISIPDGIHDINCCQKAMESILSKLQKMDNN